MTCDVCVVVLIVVVVFYVGIVSFETTEKSFTVESFEINMSVIV